VEVNGRSVGEGGLNTMLAEWYGVPVVLVTGDDVAVAEVKEVATGAQGVVVKNALNVRAARLRPLAVVRSEIEAGARAAVESAAKPAPRRAAAYRVRMRFRDTLIPQIASAFPSIERPSPDTVAFETRSMPEAYRLIRVLYRFINPD
jgi:D-amino peptidase